MRSVKSEQYEVPREPSEHDRVSGRNRKSLGAPTMAPRRRTRRTASYGWGGASGWPAHL